VYYPDPLLRRLCAPVERFDNTLREIADEMTALMQSRSGIGLAAPQAGLDQRLLVCGIESQLIAMANPTILESAHAGEFLEGCLSLPGITVKVMRPERIRVCGYDVHGRRRSFGATGLWARVIQHELDHLNGVLICDYGRPAERCESCPLALSAALVEECKRRPEPSSSR
jgi:peptide deformylase